MPDTVANQIIEALVAGLAGAGDLPAGFGVSRSRYMPNELADLPLVALYFIREDVLQPQGRRGTADDRLLRIRARIWQHSKLGETDAAIEPLREFVTRTLLADLSIGGLALNISEESSEWDADETTESDFAVADTDFLIRYATRRGQLAGTL
jgi:hypothetical protein